MYLVPHRTATGRTCFDRDDLIEARAAEILADNNQLSNAMGCEPKIEQAVCDIARICADRLSWENVGYGRFYRNVPPPALLAATTALRDALSNFAEKEMDAEGK
jgi:hypothetical protein